jgi:hypothetical protein
VRVLELPGLDAKGDVVDWAAAGGTPEQFHALVDRDARPWQAPEGNGLDHGEAELKHDPCVSPEFSEDRLSLHFVDRHGDALRYVATWGKWLAWTGSLWQIENTLAAFDMARKICREAAAQCNKASTANAIAKGKTVSAVEIIARSDRRVALTSTQLDNEDEILNTPAGSALLE